MVDLLKPSPPAPAAATPPSLMSLASSLALLKPLLAMVSLLILLAAALVAGGRWLLLSEEGARWLLNRLPGVQVTDWQGALLGAQWRAKQLRVQWDQGAQFVVIEDLRAHGVALALRPHAHAWMALAADSVQAARVTLDTGPRGPRPIVLPDSLAFPLQLNLRDARVAELRIDQLAPFIAVVAEGLALDPRPQARHAALQVQGQWQGLQLQAAGGMANQTPYGVQLQGSLRPVDTPDSLPDQPPWGAAVQLQGPLARLQAQATLRGVPVAAPREVPQGGPEPGRKRGPKPEPKGDPTVGAPRTLVAAPAVDLQATVRLLEAWPLDSLLLRTQDLNLQALHPRAPRTALAGSVEVSLRAADAPIQARVELRNAAPGAWSSQLLPLRQARGQLVGSLAQRQRLELNQLELSFGDAAGESGQWTGSAVWLGHELRLQTQVKDLWPQRLDNRASGMRLSGPFNATFTGLPSPDPAAKRAPQAPQARWDFDLEGLLDKAPLPVQLALAGEVREDRLDIQRAVARTANASAAFSGTLQRQPNSPGVTGRSLADRAGAPVAPRAGWRLQTQGSVRDFDPVIWWPGADHSAWRKGPHRLTAQWALDLLLPAGAADLQATELLQRLAGNGTLRVRDSQLAGLPITADLTLSHQPGGSAPATLQAELGAAGNTLVLEGSGDPLGSGLQDRLSASLNAEQLGALAPWAGLHPNLADMLPQQGLVNAHFQAEGRWPHLRSEGSVQAQQLHVAGYVLNHGTADWRLDTGTSGPLEMKLNLNGLRSATASSGSTGFSAEQLQADIRGTLQSHQLSIRGATRAGPSAALANTLGMRTGSGSAAQVQAQGTWQGENNGAGVWSGRLERLWVGAWDGGAGPANTAAPWVEARNLRASLQLGVGGTWVGLQAEPGRLLLGPPGPGQMALRWDDVQADFRSAQPHLQLRADIEPFEAAPLLARLQPRMGWRGNLKVGARLNISATERMQADLVLQRESGDLNIESDDGLQLLGLSELRLTASANNGLWQFTPVLKGRGLGELSGNVRITSTPEQRWPARDAPLQGSITAQANDIGIWAPWVPAGWRLAGRLNTTATLGGNLGAPRYTGALTGSDIAVRNLLQGVSVSAGDVSVLLEGETARIERFTLKGGEGRIDVSGSANWAESPSLRLQLKAERFRVLGRLDRQLTASGQASLGWQSDQGRLDGRFSIDEGLFDTTAADAPSLDSDVTIRGENDTISIANNADNAPRRRSFVVAMDLALGEHLRVRGRGLDTTLKGAVKVTNPDGRLAVNGNIRSEGGTYAAYGQKLDIERGVLAFNGAVDNPRLDVLALRPNIDTRVGVVITGPAQAPRVRLFAEPEMSDTDKLSWLVLGRAPDGLGRSDTALLQRAAVALLSGEGEAPTDTLLKSLGIDEISLRQGDSDVRETVVTLGKQLSRRWYVGYERGVNAATGTWQLIYRIAQRFTLRAQSGLENSLDVIWVWRTQETPADAGMRKSTVVPK
jgi:translocation and assembly module TamB